MMLCWPTWTGHCDLPLLLIHQETESARPANAADQSQFELQDFQVTILSHGTDQKAVQGICQTLLGAIPLDEPFERIGQAIDEAQAVVR